MLHSRTRTPDAWANTSLRDRWFALAEEIAAAREPLVDEMVDYLRGDCHRVRKLACIRISRMESYTSS